MATAVTLEIPTAEWAEPLLAPRRYKGAKGGRSRTVVAERSTLRPEARLEDPAHASVTRSESRERRGEDLTQRRLPVRGQA